MKKLILTLCVLTTSCFAHDRMYIDENELDTAEDAFYLHVGSNEYFRTETVHKDKTGLFTYVVDIARVSNAVNATYQKTWKCPYCHQQNAIGEACTNSNCPSKYPERKK